MFSAGGLALPGCVFFRQSSMLLSEEVWCMRELKYSSAAEMSEAIDKYFEDCDGHPLTDENGDVVTDKYGNPIIVGAHPPTVTGLALWLGFKTRQSLLDYQSRDKAFNDVLTRAKSRCEEYAERRLYDRDGACTLARF